MTTQKQLIFARSSPVLLQVKVNGGLKSHNVRIRPKPGYDATTDRRNERITTEFFSGVDVRKMDLDGGNVDRRDGIPEGHARMGVSCRVEDYEVVFAKRLLDPRYQLAFDIGLPALDLDPHPHGPMSNLFVNLGQGSRTIDLRFPCR